MQTLNGFSHTFSHFGFLLFSFLLCYHTFFAAVSPGKEKKKTTSFVHKHTLAHKSSQAFAVAPSSNRSIIRCLWPGCVEEGGLITMAGTSRAELDGPADREAAASPTIKKVWRICL